jgi:leucyl-tRNA synthetase
MKDYNHKEIEKKWQKEWENNNLFKTNPNPKDKMYILTEFPYPSGNLHVGHWYAFAVTDIFARYMHHIGKDVFFPFGFDSFGLPAENAAIKRGLNPKTWTYSNIEHMIQQVKNMGTMVDWDTQVITSDPEYYKWTQWLFLQFYKKGLVKYEQTHVNWCPSCKTVLANEQLEGGVCERCSSPVEQKEMKQWNIEITKYADRLIDDLDTVQWPHHIKEAQKNWIGRSHGTFFTFEVKTESGVIPSSGDIATSLNGVIPAPVFTSVNSGEIQDHNTPQADFINAQGNLQIKVFTTRPDTLFGVTYVVVAPEHELVQSLKSHITNWSEVDEYIQQTNKKTDLDRQTTKDKTGVELKGIKAINPATQKEVPVFISDYVIASYGTGCVMAVPAHDERDNEFAQKFNLPSITIIEPITGTPLENEEDRKSIVAVVENTKTGEVLSINWGEKLGGNLLIGGGLEEGENPIDCAKREITEETGYKNVEFIAQSELIHHHYRAHSKNVNRNIEAIGLYFKLIDDEKIEQSLEENEKNKFIVEWVDKKQLISKIKDPLHSYILKKFTDNHVHEGDGIITGSNNFNGLSTQEAIIKITEAFGEKTTTYKLKDWSVSRQRYWGCPIPMVHCAKCGTNPVPEDHLPVKLPDMEKIEMRDDGKSPLAHNHEWITTTCPVCGGVAERETDTLDTFVDSSWYYTRYIDPKNASEFASKENLHTWMPVDFYSGGSEHTTRHLLYARFVYKVMFDLGLVEQTEPFIKRNNRGLILGTDGGKMSKSKGNVLEPDEYVEKVGSDVVRSYLAFMGPYGEAGSYPWDPNGVVGIRRFFERVYGLTERLSEIDSKESLVAINTMISQITFDFEQLKFNTALSKIMICVNVLEKSEFTATTFKKILIVLDVFAPHLSQELWNQIGESGFIHNEKFPSIDKEILQDQKIKIAVQINGKTRAILEVMPNSSREEVLSQAKQSPEVLRWIGEKEIQKEIFVPQKLVSFVIST